MSDEEGNLSRKPFESEGQYALRVAQELAARLEQHSREVNQQFGEVAKQFDVVAGHLATLAVGQQKLQEAQIRAEQKWERTEEGIRMLLAVTEIQSQEIKALGEAQSMTNSQLAETSERLNVLIGTVERYIGGRNGDAS
jgi:DNA-binding transcriptional regulator YiaG